MFTSQRTNMNPKCRISLFTVIALAALVLFAYGAEPEHGSPGVSADAALAKLQEGNKRFTSNDVSAGKPTAARRAETGQAQHPFAIIVSCADSRVGPEIVFDQNIGDIFVIRNAGNLADEHVG